MRTTLAFLFMLFVCVTITSCESSADKANKERLRLELQDRLSILKADLSAAKDKLETTKQFKLLRTKSEREQQIREATLQVERILDQISETERAIQRSFD